MSIDLRKTGKGTHSSSPNATHCAQCTTAHSPRVPSGRFSEISNEASSICKSKSCDERKLYQLWMERSFHVSFKTPWTRDTVSDFIYYLSCAVWGDGLYVFMYATRRRSVKTHCIQCVHTLTTSHRQSSRKSPLSYCSRLPVVQM